MLATSQALRALNGMRGAATMSDAATSARFRAQGADEAAALVRNLCIHLPEPEKAASFGAFFDRYANARVVLLGEATHGTSEFYRARAAITRRLIERHGFTIVAVEADWPDAAARRLPGSKSKTSIPTP